MKIAWLFPGQGTQHVGMGQALAAHSAAARAVFETADRALEFSIRSLCFEGPEAELTLTKHAQPAIVSVSLATLAALREAVPELPAPAFAAGHSLGEYSALVAAGALRLEDAVRLVHLRGRAMQEAVPEGHGGMAAIIGGDADTVGALCAEASQGPGDAATPANYNAPGQVVISGHKPAVERAATLAQARKLKAIPLNVSAPFHSPLMKPAAFVIDEALSRVAIGGLAFPVVANATAEPNAAQELVRELLVRQMDAPVLWEQSVRVLADAGVTHALEIGPGKVLAGLVKRTDKRISVLSVGDVAAIGEVRGFLALT